MKLVGVRLVQHGDRREDAQEEECHIQFYRSSSYELTASGTKFHPSDVEGLDPWL